MIVSFWSEVNSIQYIKIIFVLWLYIYISRRHFFMSVTIPRHRTLYSTYTFINLMRLSEGVFDVFLLEIAAGKDTASLCRSIHTKNIMFFPCEKKKTRKNNHKDRTLYFFPSFKGKQQCNSVSLKACMLKARKLHSNTCQNSTYF